MSFAEDVLATTTAVAAALTSLGVPWAVGGSLASSVHGEPRATNDVDFIAAMRPAHVAGFVRALGADFYADESVILEAVNARASFNVIDQKTIVKVDVFVPAPGPLGEDQLRKRQPLELPNGTTLLILGPEDTVLQKLRWFELGNRVSDRQWRDIVSLLRIAGPTLDWTYLRETAAHGQLVALLDRAVEEATGPT